MAKLFSKPAVYENGSYTLKEKDTVDFSGREKTIAYGILNRHDKLNSEKGFGVKFDSLISHDITYVGIIQTAIASGLKEFPVPYVMTNCHNSLCAVGGTINEDDHMFGLSAAKKYGGIYVPANMAVIHQYAREELSGCGKMVLGSDSHTRYGAIGTMGVGEGGPELVKQLLNGLWEIQKPEVVLVWLKGKPRRGVGPHDIAIDLCGAVYKNGFVKNKILEFAGPGVKELSMDFRIGIDVMTTETACLSSIWETDEKVSEYLTLHGRANEYKKLTPENGAVYDSVIEIDLSESEPMAALPFHPSEAVTIRTLQENAEDILHQIEKSVIDQFGGKVKMDLSAKLVNGKIKVDQGSIVGCAGGMFDNIAEAAAILVGYGTGTESFSLSVYPPSIPVQMELLKTGIFEKLSASGAIFKPCFCGPCFGAGDVPANNALSIRHATRNFPNREGSRPGDGQMSAVLLMDARSIAATARNHGIITSAIDIDYEAPEGYERRYDRGPYEKRCYFGFGKADEKAELQYGPNIVPWPEIPHLSDNLLLKLASVIHDEVTTTDELIPSGETSSYRSNPLKLASFALSRRDPEYVGRTEKIRQIENRRASGAYDEEILKVIEKCGYSADILENTLIESVIFAEKPGDGSAREQAASCQRVLGAGANICREFATKRYRSNCVNWGMLPFTIDENTPFDYEPGDWVFVPGIREIVEGDKDEVKAFILHGENISEITLYLKNFSREERDIVLSGCLMNNYADKAQ